MAEKLKENINENFVFFEGLLFCRYIITQKFQTTDETGACFTYVFNYVNIHDKKDDSYKYIIKTYDVVESKKDLNPEINMFLPEKPKGGEKYFFIDVFDAVGKKMPLYQGVLDDNIKKKDPAKYLIWREDIEHALYESDLTTQDVYYFFSLCNDLSLMIGSVFSSIESSQSETDIGGKEYHMMEAIDSFNFVVNSCYDREDRLIKIEKIDSDVVKNYVLAVIDSFKEGIIISKVFKICPKCQQAFIYKDIKKYCCEKCKTSAKNRRYYMKSLLKDIE
jgi:hypothetical protein